MSSIRLFILGSLAQHGEMHGHQLRLLAEEEHVHLWTDISVGGLYGAIKRIAGEGLIDVVRVEREGNFPERQVYAISPSGRAALTALRVDELSAVSLRPDPFDLALTRLDPDRLDELPAVIEARVGRLRQLLVDTQAENALALPHLSLSETFAMNHRDHRLRAEIAWHDELIAALPAIVADERGGAATTHVAPHSAHRVDPLTRSQSGADDAAGPLVHHVSSASSTAGHATSFSTDPTNFTPSADPARKAH